MMNYLTPQQREAYEFFKKFAKRNGRLPNEKEIMENMNLATVSQALYWAGNILLKGGFGLKVAANPGVIEFGDYNFPMMSQEDRAAVQPVQQTLPHVAPVAQAVAEVAPVSAADEYKDAPVAIRNLIKRVEVAKKQKAEKPVEAIKRDVMDVMGQLKKYNVSVPVNSSAIYETLKESGKSWKSKQVSWVVHNLIKERKLKGVAKSFTYL